MTLLIDEYRKNWAIRYIREAESDLSISEATSIPLLSINLTLVAMRKMQTAIYYALGDPSSLASLVKEAFNNGFDTKDHLMGFLVQVEWLIQIWTVKANTLEAKQALQEAGQLMKLTSKIVENIIGKTDHKVIG